MWKKRRKRKNKSLLFFLCILCLSFLLFSFLENRFLPPLKEISHMQCKALANQIIDKATINILNDTDFSTASLLIREEDGEGYTANTALVNQFCSRLSADVTQGLQDLPKEVIRIPLGAATKWSFFANLGPKIPFTLIPMGTAKVDYETAFSSVGINQINYKIWLNLSMEIKIVNPLYQETLTMERKIMLADLIFSGKIPEHYFQMSRPNEYLLTE
ncbi:sporulation protein YunB [Anaerotignum sp.]